MYLQLEHFEVVYGSGTEVTRSLTLSRDKLVTFLEKFFQHLYSVDGNRNCHSCTSACRHAITMHLGRPFHSKLRECVPP